MNNFNKNLAIKIWKNTTFQAEYAKLYFANIYYSFIHEKHDNTPDIKAIIRLLKSASVLSLSAEPSHRKAAYRIAVSTIRLFSRKLENLSNILHVIFGRLGNFPAIDFMYKELNKSKSYSIPSSLLYELLEHEGKNSFKVGASETVFTDFQTALWNNFTKDKIVSVSAPTSAGKSFTLQHYLINQILSAQANYILYLVPTRALIGQVGVSIAQKFNDNNIDIPVSSIPESREDLGITKGVYILTQERAHTLIEVDKEIPFDIVVVDEAQTIGSGSRGVLLQVVIDNLISQNPSSKFFFGSPFSNNPSYFSCLFDEEIKQIKEQESPVTQNLISVNIPPTDPCNMILRLFENGIEVDLASMTLEKEIIEEKSFFAYASYILGKKSKNILYAGSPSACEDIANKIRQWVDEDNGENTPEIPAEIQELSKFIRDHIHKDYFLADMVERGIAFHYGKMPTVLRKAIEDAFSENSHMKFLVCTSTLLHGVNLPAKNLFLLKPSEGEEWLSPRAIALSSPSFWNLAGRAGRLGKDFEGNVFLINKQQWIDDPLSGDREQLISSSFYNTVREHHEQIVELAKSQTDVVESKPNWEKEEIESTFVKLYTDFKKGKLEKVLNKSPLEIPFGFQEEIKEAFEALNYLVPDGIIESNIGIPPHFQEKMLQYIIKNIEDGKIDKLIPLHPEMPNAYQSLVRLFSRFETKFGKKEKASKAPRRLAAIALSWMKGMPYPNMIKKQIEYKPTSKLPTVIRETMETIETSIRFKCVQQTRCYLDLLKHGLTVHALESKLTSIPALPLYLEIGASSGTMINLVGIGFSRTTAGLINKYAANKGMNRTECYNWLKRENWVATDLPRICLKEINSILGSS